MNTDPVEKIANAILYEGFLLYPYRLSSVKNRLRWTFGVLYPPGYCRLQGGSESSEMQTECLVEGDAQTVVTSRVRFLQHRAGETVEREVLTEEWGLAALSTRVSRASFSFPGLEGLVEGSAMPVTDRTFKLGLRISNTTAFHGGDREQALLSSFLSAHTLLRVRDGAFHSMIDPPEALVGQKEQCRNIGTWPVLVGQEGQRDRMLSAPIILYDYPKVAPQSPGDLFDGTEIDEILTLRVLTLTDEEKQQMGQEAQSAALLRRTEALTGPQVRNLHGAWRREDDPGTGLKTGDHVRLRPKGRADIFDLALAGRAATVSSVETDFEGNIYICVTVDDDPGRDLGLEGRPGHRFFFRIDEVEKI